MIYYIKDFYFKTNFLERSFLIIICLFPISIILGNLIINLLFFLIFIIFCLDTLKNRNFSFVNDYTFQLLALFFFSLIVNLYFSKEPLVSLPRILKITEVITLVIMLNKIIQKYQTEFENVVFGFWGLIFFIVIIDIFFELVFGFNTIGFEPAMPGRVASFFGNELIVGSFFLCFSSIYIVRVSKLFKKNKDIKLFFLIIFLIITSLLLGERSNFIKFFIISIFLIMLIVNLKLKYKIFGALLFFLTFSLVLNFNENIKYRYYSQQIENFVKETKSIKKDETSNIFIKTKNNIINFVKWTKYGAHYNTAYQVFLDNPYFGAGIKNFRIESYKEKYRNEEYKWTDERFNTHPHQIHFEFLSETGLFGYFCFLFFIITSIYLSIKNFLKYKNLYQLVSILYVCVVLIPFLPSGSFFSTLSSTLFWLNYAVMMSYNKSKQLKII